MMYEFSYPKILLKNKLFNKCGYHPSMINRIDAYNTRNIKKI
jgi:hypothetical protein